MNLAIALAIFLAGFGAAWSWQGVRGEVALAELRLEHSTAALDQVRSLVKAIRDGQVRADRISTAAAQREASLDEKLQETHRALKTATLGRPCLGGDALRLLDQSPGLRAPAGPPDGGRAAPAADSSSLRAGGIGGGAAQGDGPPPVPRPEGGGDWMASDTDVADWIATAGRYYQRCRNRLADIRAYEAGQ